MVAFFEIQVAKLACWFKSYIGDYIGYKSHGVEI
jgi:hypothetical protein